MIKARLTLTRTVEFEINPDAHDTKDIYEMLNSEEHNANQHLKETFFPSGEIYGEIFTVVSSHVDGDIIDKFRVRPNN